MDPIKDLIEEVEEILSRALSESEELEENKPKLGSGGRFKALVGKLRARGDVRDPKAAAAAIGRKKWGAKRMAKMAAAHR